MLACILASLLYVLLALQNTPIWEESKATKKQNTVKFKLRAPPLTAFKQKMKPLVMGHLKTCISSEIANPAKRPFSEMYQDRKEWRIFLNVDVLMIYQRSQSAV